MIPTIIIEPDIPTRVGELERILVEHQLHKNHPNLFWIEDEKLGIQNVRKVADHLSLKPFQGSSQAVVIINSDLLTLEAQNALLKTLEEPPGDSIILLGASTEHNFLPTVLSRCQIIYLTPKAQIQLTEKNQKKIEELIASPLEKRFQIIESIDEKEQFLGSFVAFFHQKLTSWDLEFLEDLIQAQIWAKSNVNPRAILEYLMLKLP